MARPERFKQLELRLRAASNLAWLVGRSPIWACRNIPGKLRLGLSTVRSLDADIEARLRRHRNAIDKAQSDES